MGELVKPKWKEHGMQSRTYMIVIKCECPIKNEHVYLNTCLKMTQDILFNYWEEKNISAL